MQDMPFPDIIIYDYSIELSWNSEKSEKLRSKSIKSKSDSPSFKIILNNLFMIAKSFFLRNRYVITDR